MRFEVADQMQKLKLYADIKAEGAGGVLCGVLCGVSPI